MELEKWIGPSHQFAPAAPPTFDMAGLSGKVVEFSGWDQSACVSLTIPLIRECQSLDRGCVWIVPDTSRGSSLFFPPDFAEAGIDCSILPIVRSNSGVDGFGIAEKLVRSGGFGLVVLDLSEGINLPGGRVGRVHNLAQRYGSLVLCLTRSPPEQPSLDPMVFVQIHITGIQHDSDSFEICAVVQKDKTRSTGRRMTWSYEAPIGLR